MIFTRVVVMLATLVAQVLLLHKPSIDDEERPFDVVFLESYFKMNEGYGDSDVDLEENEGLTVMNGWLNFKKDLPCSVRVGMTSRHKQGGNWVMAYQSNPKLWEPYMLQNREMLDMLFKYSNLTEICPLKAGKYVINDFVTDASKLPKSVQLGIFRVGLTMDIGITRILEIETKLEIVPKPQDEDSYK